MYFTGNVRSLRGDEALPLADNITTTNVLLDDNTFPYPFDFNGHLSAITTHRNKRSANSRRRYVLFILDSSLSISNYRFTMLKQVLSELIPLFCGNTVFGVMSYGSRIERNICFDCDQGSREDLRQAVLSIPFHGGETRSGDAIRCACDYMLSRSCGYFNEPNSITDVIFITDGHSNRGEDVCTAASCIPHGVNVISIGIGNTIDYDELECIEGDNGGLPGHIFDVVDFAGLQALQQTVEAYLIRNKLLCRSI